MALIGSVRGIVLQADPTPLRLGIFHGRQPLVRALEGQWAGFRFTPRPVCQLRGRSVSLPPRNYRRTKSEVRIFETA